MFRPNLKHQQTSFFGIQNVLPTRLQKKLQQSKEHFFYETIFCNIKEEDFSVLYSEKVSRPNAAVNCLVSAFILKHSNNWSFEELFDNIEFNILTKTALGLDTLDDIPFDDATIFNFQNRMLSYEVETGENLLEKVFDSLTEKQLKELNLKTNIQRSDSLMASSNIRNYSHLQLLIEVIQRLFKVLSPSDKEIFQQRFENYTNKSSGQYLYGLKASDIPHEINKIAELYQFCMNEIIPKYQEMEISKIFERVYSEHFTEVEGKIEVKPKNELNSSCLQSPDDLDATFREKRGVSYKGQSINITETAHPDNPINLLTDIAVNPNNIDDSKVLNNRIERIIEKTGDLEELHTDGAYGSAENDIKFEELGITHIQTAVRGSDCENIIEIEQIADDSYIVKCPMQSVCSEKAPKRYKAIFNKEICQDCVHAESCPSAKRKHSRTFYFTHEYYLRKKRHRSILNIPESHRKIRPNVESSIHQISCRLTNKKLKVRGQAKAGIFAFATGIAINFLRIFNYCENKLAETAVSLLNLVQIVKELSIMKNIFSLFFYLKKKNKYFLLCDKIDRFLPPQKIYCF
jgi:hypothetical protein